MPVKLISPGGGSVVIAPASTSSNYTLTVPAATANVVTTGDSNTITQTMMNTGFYAGYGPAFSAYSSSTTSMTNSAFTKIAFQTEEFDTANCFDSTTNYRFTPGVAGYYQFNAVLAMPGGTYAVGLVFYKNGSRFKDGNFIVNNTTTGSINVVTALMYMNGSTDYVEVYGYQSSGGAVNCNTGASQTYFQGFLVRSA